MFRSKRVLRIICFEPFFLAFNPGSCPQSHTGQGFSSCVFSCQRAKKRSFWGTSHFNLNSGFFCYGAGQYRSARPKSVAAQGFSPFPKLPPPTTADTKVPSADKTRNPPQLRLFRPPVSLCFQGFSRVLKTKYFAVLTRRSNILVFPLF